jgi:large subunit ribosomal protein L30
VTQVRSSIGTKPKHRGTLRALGLRGVGRSRVQVDSPTLRGMLAQVSHLVEVEAVVEPAKPTATRTPRTQTTSSAPRKRQSTSSTPRKRTSS